jgi:hypothetical protein
MTRNKNVVAQERVEMRSVKGVTMGWLRERREFKQRLEATKDEAVILEARAEWLQRELEDESRRSYQRTLVPHVVGLGHGWNLPERLGAAFESYFEGFRRGHSGSVPEKLRAAGGDLDVVYVFDDIHRMTHGDDPAWVLGGSEFRETYAMAAAAIFMKTSPYAKRLTITKEVVPQLLAVMMKDFDGSKRGTA